MTVRLLDCTLRDGGYVNDWNFGERKLKSITKKLIQSKCDILELGFLKTGNDDVNKSLFSNADEFYGRLEIEKPKDLSVVAMYDDKPSFDINTLAECGNNTVDGIRFIFKPGGWRKMKIAVEAAKERGYKVYINPMLTNRYSDIELLQLVEDVNCLMPESLSIVDTFGSIHRNMLLHIFQLIDHNLDKRIAIGYHSHNNMQLAYGNALSLIDLRSNRDIILDCSCFGMGRGGGNLPTELMMKHLIDIGADYNLSPVLDIIDNELMPIYQNTPWGYSVPHFLSASMDVHPNYALYLMNMSRLTIDTIRLIMSKIEPNKQTDYDEQYIAKLYLEFQSKEATSKYSLARLKSQLFGTNVLVIAPGKSVVIEREKIDEYISKYQPKIISVNTPLIDSDYIFVGNQRRFDDLSDYSNVIVTSNIDIGDKNLDIVDYYSIIEPSYSIEMDNSGMMCLRLLKLLGVMNVAVAGFDGFTLSRNDYADDKLAYFTEIEIVEKRNENINTQLAEIRKGMNITFVTDTIYEDLPSHSRR